MSYRDPDTGRFITHEQWESLQSETFSDDDFEDWQDLDYFDDFGEEEY